MSPVFYKLLTSLLTPFLPIYLRRRARAGKEDASRLRERMGHASIDRPPGELIWLHGASVGETQMLRPLIDRLLETPDRHVLVTSGTKTSADLLARQLPDRAIHQYLPVDTQRAAARFIAYWRPDLCVFAESELWPNLIWTASRSEAPLALINARMSERSLKGWRKRMGFAQSVLERFDLLLAADTRTAKGLASITMRNVRMIGNLKDDAPALAFDQAEADRLRAAIGDRPVWLAASTHEAEEGEIDRIRRAVGAYMIWLPRHPDRGHAVSALSGFPRRSQGEAPSPHGYIMDTLGEMGLALALVDVCVMGGSFVPSLAGHNPLEASRAGVPVLTGPYHDSFSDIYDSLLEMDAVRVVSDDDAPAAIRLGLDGALSDQAARASAYVAAQSGVLDETVAQLDALLRRPT